MKLKIRGEWLLITQGPNAAEISLHISNQHAHARMIAKIDLQVPLQIYLVEFGLYPSSLFSMHCFAYFPILFWLLNILTNSSPGGTFWNIFVPFWPPYIGVKELKTWIPLYKHLCPGARNLCKAVPSDPPFLPGNAASTTYKPVIFLKLQLRSLRCNSLHQISPCFQRIWTTGDVF